jgi:prevent-host-death family protein
MLRDRMKATRSEPEVITRNGKAVSVIVPIAEYEELLERAEDATDLKWLKHARAGKLQYRPLEEYMSERKTKARA